MYGTGTQQGHSTGINKIPPPVGTPPSSAQGYSNSSGQFTPKRHPDFIKSDQSGYPVNSAYGMNQPGPPSQYTPFGAPMRREGVSTSTGMPQTSQGMWGRESQYRSFGPNTSGSQFGIASSRHAWDPVPNRNNESGSGNSWPMNRYSGASSMQPPHGDTNELYSSGSTPQFGGGTPTMNKMFPPRSDPNRMFPMNAGPPNKVPPHLMGPGASQMPTPPTPYSHHHVPSHPHHPAFHQQKREIVFPPDSVEAVQPTMLKRRRLTARDINSVEAWRLLMCLKSGLLGEATWALDVLSILLHDDNTILYFGLQHLPGLLEVLLEHYKRYLSDIFDGLFDDTEIGLKTSRRALTDANIRKKQWYELVKDLREESSKQVEDEEKEAVNGLLSSAYDDHYLKHKPEQLNGYFLKVPERDNERTVLLNSSVNFTFKSRDGKPVKIRNGKNLFVLDAEKKWDTNSKCFSGAGSEHWSNGWGESTNHIQTHFETPERCVRFARLIKNKPKVKRAKIENEENKSALEDDDRSNKVLLNGDLSPATDDVSFENSCAMYKREAYTNSKNSPIRVKSETTDETDSKSDKENEVKEMKEKEESSKTDTYPRIRECDLTRYRKRKEAEEVEDESYDQDDTSVNVCEDYQDALQRRCLCLSTLIRNLSFVPGNDIDMSKHPGLLLVLSRLILLHHTHTSKKRNFDRSVDDEMFNLANDEKEKDAPEAEKEWWWEMLHLIRENTLVTIANISGQLDLMPFNEEISLPFLDGLVHWIVCPSSYAHDPLPTTSLNLSPQRLSLEALTKLSILDSNVNLLLATPPWPRIDKMYKTLARSLSRHEDQTVREFAVVLLSNLSAADSSASRAIALTGCAIAQLISFVEQAEQSALQVANSQGINALRENPELMGTTLDMVRRSASTLRCLSRVPDNRPLFLQYQQRLLALVMSQILDQGVAGIIADVIYECSLAEQLLLPSISESEPVSEEVTTPPSAVSANDAVEAPDIADRSSSATPPISTDNNETSSPTTPKGQSDSIANEVAVSAQN